jgi:hypothetical protein
MARRIGSRCRHHADRYGKTGHPEGATIPRAVWHPWRDKAAHFIGERLDHPGIAAALDWLLGLMRDARAPSRTTKRTSPHDRFALFLQKMHRNGVEPVALLASVAAIYALREEDDRRFKSDRHFRFQIAIAFLSVVPRPKHSSGKRWRNGAAATVDPSARLRDHVGRTLEVTIGVLAGRIGAEVFRRAQPPRPLHGQHLDFNEPNPSNKDTTT